MKLSLNIPLYLTEIDFETLSGKNSRLEKALREKYSNDPRIGSIAYDLADVNSSNSPAIKFVGVGNQTCMSFCSLLIRLFGVRKNRIWPLFTSDLKPVINIDTKELYADAHFIIGTPKAAKIHKPSLLKNRFFFPDNTDTDILNSIIFWSRIQYKENNEIKECLYPIYVYDTVRMTNKRGKTFQDHSVEIINDFLYYAGNIYNSKELENQCTYYFSFDHASRFLSMLKEQGKLDEASDC